MIFSSSLGEQSRKPNAAKNKDRRVRGVLEGAWKEWTARFQQESGAEIGQAVVKSEVRKRFCLKGEAGAKQGGLRTIEEEKVVWMALPPCTRSA